MDWPFKYHSKGRPCRPLFFARRVRTLLLGSILLVLGVLEGGRAVQGDSSPPVADVEDLFKDEGFLRMSRGGEAFGGRRPPPPLVFNPPHLSTQAPPRPFVSPSPPPPSKERKPFLTHRKTDESRGGDGGDENKGPRDSNDRGRESGAHGLLGSSGQPPPEVSKPLEKDVSAVFSKVGAGNSEGGGGGSGPTVTDSESHPLLGITPAAPGDPFDFNPILSNPAVTRILAGSSGRIPQWEPTLTDLHDLIPEGNYSGDTHNNRVYGGNSNNLGLGNPANGGPLQQHNSNPRNPVFVPSPVNSGPRGSSPTMYNMDQMTNNIAIPRHTLPNPSNLATSRTTIMSEEQGGGGDSESSNYGELEQPGTKRPNYHFQDTRRDGLNLFNEEDDSGMNEHPYKNYIGGNGGEGPIPGREPGQNGQGAEAVEGREEAGTKASICDALCGAWRHQCKLMGILFSITSVLCFLFALVVLYSLHFGLKDFLPFCIILLLLLTTSASRSVILLSGWYCPHGLDPQPAWLPIASTLPSALFTIAILVALRLARFPFPFLRSYTISIQMIVILSLVAILPPLGLSLGATFYRPSSGVLSQVAWIVGHVILAIIALLYLIRFKVFYVRLGNERGTGISNGNSNTYSTGPQGSSQCGPALAFGNGNNNMSSGLKKRPFVAKWGRLQARAMFGAALLVLSLCTIVIISVSLNGGNECSTWPGWVLSLCARILELAVVILLLLVTVSSADIRFFNSLSRNPVNKLGNGGLVNADLFPTMVSSNAAVQRCIPTYSANTRADVVMLGGTENRSSLRGKTFGERALPGERVGEYRSSVGRGLPLRLGNGPSHSMPGTPLDGFPQGLRLPEPAPASLLVTKVVFGTPAVSREVNLNHQHDNPLLCVGGSSSRDEASNIYASLESVKVSSMPNGGSSNGSNHSGSDRVLLSAPRDYVYSISRDLTKTIDSIYDTSRARNNMQHNMDGMHPSLAQTIEQIGSIGNLNGTMGNRPSHFNAHAQNMHNSNGNVSLTRAELARTIDRMRFSGGASTAPNSTMVTPTSSHPGRNFVLQFGGGPNGHLPPGILNPPPYYSSESSHDVTPDSGIVSDMHAKSGRSEPPDLVRAREFERNSIEDVRRLPLLPMPNKQRTPGSTPLYDRTPTSPPNGPPTASPAIYHPGTAPVYIPPNPPNSVVGRVEHLLNQTEHILSRTESLDSNTQATGLQRLLSHKEQLEHVEKLLAQAEYAIWVEKRNCAQQVSQLSPSESQQSQYGYGPRGQGGQLTPTSTTPNTSSHTNSANGATQTQRHSGSHSNHGSRNNGSNNSGSSDHHHPHRSTHQPKKLSKNLEEESVV